MTSEPIDTERSADDELLPLDQIIASAEAAQNALHTSESDGKHGKFERSAGKKLEYLLEFMRAQGIEVTAALLWEADEWLIGSYYFLPGGRK